MTRLRTGPPQRPALVGRWTLPAVVIAVIAGLVWMHALSAGDHCDAAPAAGQVTSIAAADPFMSGDGHSNCPSDLPEHPGPICRSGAVPGTAAAVTAAALGAASGRVEVMVPVPVSAVAAALDSGGGSGCGPPSLTMFSISRT